MESPDAMVSGAEEDGLILFSTGDNAANHSNEPLTCPVILPGEDDVSIGAAAAAHQHNRSGGVGGGGDPLLCMGAREEGEISPPPAHSGAESHHHQMHHLHHNEDTVDGDIGLPALTDGEECGALQVDEDTDGTQSPGEQSRLNDSSALVGDNGANGDTSGDEVEIMGEYRDFSNITLLGTTTNASGTSSRFIIPPLNPMLTGFITGGTANGGPIPLPTTTKLHITTSGGHGLPSQVQFVTTDGQHQPLQIGLAPHITISNTNNDSSGAASSGGSRVGQVNSTGVITMDETEAKVAQVSWLSGKQLWIEALEIVCNHDLCV